MKSLFDKLVERWAGIRMMEEQAKAEDVAESLRLGQELVRAHYRTHLGENFSGDSKVGSTHIGDVTHNHSETNTDTDRKSWLPKLLLLGGLLASAGAGSFLPALFGLASEEEGGPVDLDTKYDLKLGEPDEIQLGEGKDQGR